MNSNEILDSKHTLSSCLGYLASQPYCLLKVDMKSSVKKYVFCLMLTFQVGGQEAAVETFLLAAALGLGPEAGNQC